MTLPAKRKMNPVFLIVGIVVLLCLIVLLTGRSAYGWRTWGFRATHTVVAVKTSPYLGSKSVEQRDVYFVMKPNDSLFKEARACAVAFAHAASTKSQTVCLGFASEAGAKKQLSDPTLRCQSVVSYQYPYMDAQQATNVQVNETGGCA